jgi:hypothetical protein
MKSININEQKINKILTLIFLLTVFSRRIDAQQGYSIFNDPALKLKEIGQLKKVNSKDIKSSRLSIGFETLDRFLFDPGKCYDKLAVTGIKWARCQTGWCRCEKEKGKYDFQWLDDVVDNLLKRGIQPWFNVGYGNKLYMPNAIGEAAVGWVPLYFGDETLQAWGNYVRALANHFKGRVSYYEIWNEPNISSFWQPTNPSPAEYLRLISISSKIIKDEDASAKIGACVSGTISSYVVELAQLGVSKYIDFFTIHPYRIIPEKGYENEIKSLRLLFAENGGGHVKLWQGECGYASYFPSGSNFMHAWHTGNESQHAKWLLRRYFIDLSLKLDLTSFFQMVDMTANDYETSQGKQVPPLHGLLYGERLSFPAYEPKVAYFAACHFAAVFDEDTEPADIYSAIDFEKRVSWDERVSRLNEVSAISSGFLRKGYPLYVYYMPEDVQMEYPGMTDINFNFLNDTPKQIKNPVLIDLLSGRVFSITDISQNDLQFYSFHNLPLTDYPLVVTDIDALKDRIELKLD